MKILSVAPIIAAVALLSAGHARAAEESGAKWDVSVPRGETRQIQFNVSEGTWMSADISPDGRWIIFDLLGNIYRVAAEGGTATLLTRPFTRTRSPLPGTRRLCDSTLMAPVPSSTR